MIDELHEIIALAQNINGKAEDILNVVRYLRHYGYLAKTGELSINDVVEAVRKFRNFMNLADGETIIDSAILHLINCSRCGVPDIMEYRGGLSKWNKRHITYKIVGWLGGNISQMEQRAITRQAFLFIEDVCGLWIDETLDSRPDIIIDVGKGRKENFDGPGGTLAWAYLPNGTDSQLLMKIDMDETWAVTSSQRGTRLLNVVCHEGCHNVGISHHNTPNNLMNPYYSPSIEKPQRADIKELVSRYGQPRPRPVIKQSVEIFPDNTKDEKNQNE